MTFSVVFLAFVKTIMQFCTPGCASELCISMIDKTLRTYDVPNDPQCTHLNVYKLKPRVLTFIAVIFFKKKIMFTFVQYTYAVVV